LNRVAGLEGLSPRQAMTVVVIEMYALGNQEPTFCETSFSFYGGKLAF
jgi:hypothetical protein